MADTSRVSERPADWPPPPYPPVENEPRSGTGWVLFAAIMLLLVGTFQGMLGLVALFQERTYLVPGTSLVLQVDYSTWGWIHVIVGSMAAAAGIGILGGQMWARAAGVALAVLSASTTMAFLPACPMWSVVVIGIDVVAIYAIAVHGQLLED